MATLADSSPVAILGLGLIGSSLARAIKGACSKTRVVGFDIDPATRAKALELGVVDAVADSTQDLAQGSPLVVVAVSVADFGDCYRAMAPALAADAVVTDVGSVKADVLAQARDIAPQRFEYFVGGHPIAGTERSGVEAGFAELFQQRRVILTPVAETNPTATDTCRALWSTVGAEVELLAPDLHDAILAATSHLPHLLAYALVDMLARSSQADDMFRYAAGGFRDFTRIASSSPTMWRDIVLANRGALVRCVDDYRAVLDDLAQALDAPDATAIEAIFTRAKSARDRYQDSVEGLR